MIPALFKYMEAKHAQALVERGILRIGTLHEFQDTESFGAEIGDLEEGVVRTYSHEPRLTNTGHGTGDPIVDRLVHCAPGAVMNMYDCYFEIEDRAPNHYMFCMSDVADPDVMKQMDKKYDTCVEIRDPVRFGVVLTEALFEGGWGVPLGAIARCEYATRLRSLRMPPVAHPAMIKDLRYAYQREVRILWGSPAVRATAIVIQVPGLVGMCSLRALPLPSGTLCSPVLHSNDSVVTRHEPLCQFATAGGEPRAVDTLTVSPRRGLPERSDVRQLSMSVGPRGAYATSHYFTNGFARREHVPPM